MLWQHLAAKHSMNITTGGLSPPAYSVNTFRQILEVATAFWCTVWVHCVSCRRQITVAPPSRGAHTASRKIGRPDTLTHSRMKTEGASCAFSVPSNQVPEQAAENGQGMRWRLLLCNRRCEGRS